MWPCESVRIRSGIIIALTFADQERLERISKDCNAAHKHVWRAEIVLLSANRVGTSEIMRRTDTSKTCFWRWLERFMRGRLAALPDPPVAYPCSDPRGCRVGSHPNALGATRRAMARVERGCQVLAPRDERAQEPRRRRCPACRRRPPERLPRRDYPSVPGCYRADVHSPPAQEQHDFRLLEGPQEPRQRAQGSSPRAERGGSRDGADRVRGRFLGPALSRHRPGLASCLGGGDPVLCVSRRGASDRLHYQRVKALDLKLRRAVRARGHFPSDEAATKLFYLILNRSEKGWKMSPREWSMAKTSSPSSSASASSGPWPDRTRNF